MGSSDDKFSTSLNIFKLECINGQYQWQLMNAKLKKARIGFFAAIISTNFGKLLLHGGPYQSYLLYQADMTIIIYV